MLHEQSLLRCYNLWFVFCAKHRKHHAMPCDWKETGASDTHAPRGFYYPLMILRWWLEIFRSRAAWHRLFSDSFPRSWEIGLTRNKRGERSVQARSWRKNKIGVAGRIIFARTFEVRRPGFLATRSREWEEIPRNKKKKPRDGQLKTHDRGKKEAPTLSATSKKHSFVGQEESADRVIRCRTELYLLYGTFMAPIKIRSALPVGHYEANDENISSNRWSRLTEYYFSSVIIIWSTRDDHSLK